MKLVILIVILIKVLLVIILLLLPFPLSSFPITEQVDSSFIFIRPLLIPDSHLLATDDPSLLTDNTFLDRLPLSLRLLG